MEDMPDLDDYAAALLEERGRARDDQHRKEIDHELAVRGYTVGEEPEVASETERETERESEKAAAAAAERRAAAAEKSPAEDPKATPPQGRTSTRGKQSSG